MPDGKTTFNEYLSALGGAISNLTSDARNAVRLPSEKMKNGGLLIAAFKESRKEGDTTSFKDWATKEGANKAKEIVADEEKRKEAIEAANTYLENDENFKKARTNFVKDAGDIYKKANDGLGGNLMPILAAAVPVLLSMFGLFDMGGLGTILMAGAAFLGVGAMTDENSIGGQAWGWIKKQFGGDKGPGLGNDGPSTEHQKDTSKVVTLGLVKEKGDALEPVQADKSAEIVAKSDERVKISARGAEFKIGETTFVPIMDGTLVSGSAKSGTAKFESARLFDVTNNSFTGERVTMKKDAEVVVKEGAVSMTEAMASAPAEKFTKRYNIRATIANSMGDFAVGNFTMAAKFEDALDKDGNRGVTITAAARSNNKVTRTFKGKVTKSGEMVLDQVQVDEKDGSDPKFIAMPPQTFAGAPDPADKTKLDDWSKKLSAKDVGTADVPEFVKTYKGTNITSFAAVPVVGNLLDQYLTPMVGPARITTVATGATR